MSKMNKNSIRSDMRALRNGLDGTEKASLDEKINQILLSVAEGKRCVAVYLPVGNEIDISSFIKSLLAKNVRVVSPKWNGREYFLSPLKGLSSKDLKIGPMNVPESVSEEVVLPCEVDVFIVPGLCFSRSGKRIGYGGGWYDRLLKDASSACKVAVAYSFQIVDDFPSEPHDIMMDMIVVDSGLMHHSADKCAALDR